jgi:hypothetical protein
MFDLLLIVPALGVLGLLAANLKGLLSWWVHWIGLSACLLLAMGVAVHDDITAMGPFEIAVTVVMCVLIPLMWVGGQWATEALMRRFK